MGTAPAPGAADRRPSVVSGSGCRACLFTVVGTARCAVRAACSGASTWPGQRGPRSVPPAARGRGRRSAASLPANYVRTLNTYCRAATTPPRAAAERLARTARFSGSPCAAGRGATRRSATSSTTLNSTSDLAGWHRSVTSHQMVNAIPACKSGWRGRQPPVHPEVVGNGARRSRRFDVARSPALAGYFKFLGLLTLKRPEGRAPRSRQLADALANHCARGGRAPLRLNSYGVASAVGT